VDDRDQLSASIIARRTMTMWTRLRGWAQAIKRDATALYLAGRDPRVPWYAKAAAVLVAAYALSPIDLIPDFIPILGYLDDLIIVPFGIMLVARMIPPALMGELRRQAEMLVARPSSRAGAAAIVALWIAALALTVWLFWPTSAASSDA
jgi:uncharacterized membrane protein YkvA (DUF1232 family)